MQILLWLLLTKMSFRSIKFAMISWCWWQIATLCIFSMVANIRREWKKGISEWKILIPIRTLRHENTICQIKDRNESIICIKKGNDTFKTIYTSIRNRVNFQPSTNFIITIRYEIPTFSSVGPFFEEGEGGGPENFGQKLKF